MRLSSVSLAVSLSLLPALAFATPEVKPSSVPTPPPMLQKLLSMSKGQVEKEFSTPIKGLDGWYVVTPAAGPRGAVIYTDDGYALIGAFLTPQGVNLSAKYTEQYSPKPQFAKVAEEVAHAKHVIDWGNPKAPVHIIAFEDMNCIFCHLFYNSAKPFVESGKAYVQVVPVAFLKPSSPGKAIAVMDSKNPEKAYELDENGFNEKAEEGSIKPAPVTPAGEAILQRHWDWLTKQMYYSGTPGLVFQKNGVWTGMDGYDAQLIPQLLKAKGLSEAPTPVK